MKREQLKGRLKTYASWRVLLMLLTFGLAGIQQANATFGTPTRYEAESSNNGNVTVASANSGYSGSGYLTGFTSEWSYTSFDKSNPSTTSAKIDIRYANGTGAAVNNLALYVGSTKIQSLSFPTTTNWTTWATLSVTFTLDAGYQGIKIKSEANAASSVNIDYSELSLDDGTGTVAVATPTFSPAAGTYTSAQSVSISTSTSGATIYYTTDGSTPTTSSTVYSSAISVGSTQTVKAIAAKSGMSNSSVGSAAYTINIASTVATPLFSPGAGTYTSAQSVTISTTTSGATIYYTTDGSTPTTSSTVYSSAINVASTLTVKALATKSGSTDSGIASAAYTINTSTPVVATPTFSPGAGTYTAAQSVTISTSTSGATIYYTTDGSTPTTSSAVYSSAINVASTQTLKALATKSGSTNSGIGSAAYTINTGGGTVTGNITREYWAGISGTAVTDLTSNANYPNSPTSTSLLTSFESPTDVADNYGQRVKGYITAPTTGSYTFWIAADDGAELWLSTDGTAANKVKIAFVSGWTSSQDWTKYPEQTSASISLTAGTQYYVEALQKEGGGGDNLAVAWQVPGGTRVVIPSSALSTTLGGTTPTAYTPTFSPAAGTYTSAQTVTISSTTSGAAIRYTTDGTTPTSSSTLYSAPISVGSTQTVKAIAIASGYTNSAVGSAAYTINTSTPVAATPTFSPAAGTYTSAQTVTISSTTSGASIRYTTDGSTPTSSSTLYSSAISVGSTQTINAIATASGYTNSAVGSAAYTINTATPTAATPTFSPASGTYSAAQTVSISSATSGASIRFTTDGSTPTSSSTLYSGAINVGASQTIKAIAIASGYTNSAVGSAAYTINTTPPAGQAGITREFWAAIPGSSVSALTSNANYPNNPTSSSVLTSFEAPQNVADSYGQRVKGYLVPQTTGAYLFWIASDDDSELWLSTDNNPANKVKIASVTGWTNFHDYNKSPSQASASINLTAGVNYYIEALQKDDSGGDHLTVVWRGPGITQQIISSTYLLTAPPTPPGAFSQTAPAAGATGVALSPTFSWGASSNATSYTLVVANNSSYTSPIINQSGITGTSYVGSGLAGTTTYYWKVTAVNNAGTQVSSNPGLSFTTLTPPAPGTFSQTAPASGATSISRTPTFTWGAASNVSTYTLVVSTNSSYASPVINASGLTSTNYSPASQLASSTLYYWKVSATNSTGTTVASNSGISFTTGATVGNYYYVSPTGVDAAGRGSSGSPFKTMAYAASQVAPNQNNTIYLNAGTYNETEPTLLPLGVNIEGAGQSQVTIKSSGVTLPAGVTGAEGDYHLWAEGSLIQAVSPIYSGADPRYGSPSLMIAALDGNQTISGFTIDGNGKSLKAGVWVLNRNNVTMHHVDIKDIKQTGAVFSRGDMWYYEPLPEGKWMKNTIIHDCNFTNAGSNPGEQEGCLKIGGIDGCEIYNINITDANGEGIKFAHVGHHRNTKIHDCMMRLSESHPVWGEYISIELWNLGYGNEVYNVDANTWFSFVNFNQLTTYEPTGTESNNLWVHDCRIVDLDGSSSKEAMEVACSGVQLWNNYIQDKGIGMAIWNGAGSALKKNYIIRNNIFANVLRTPGFGFGNSAAVFNPDPSQNINIYNNVFDNMGNALNLQGLNGGNVKNNVFLNALGADVEGGGGVTFNNNLKYHTNATKNVWTLNSGPSLGSGNVIGNPGFKNSGTRWITYYQPASGSSFAVDKGTDVGLPFSGAAPDAGKWEFGLTSNRSEVVAQAVELGEVNAYPNPSTGMIKITTHPDVKISGVQVMNIQGKIILSKVVNQLNNVEIDLSEQANDIYILKVKHQHGVITKKVVLMK